MRRVQGLDLLRGVAVALVMLRHAFPQPFSGGGVVGVVMFFALSGYLITGTLTSELRRNGRLDLRRFYRRRAARLLPALAAMAAGVAVVTLLSDPLGDRAELPRTLAVALTYTSDLPFAHGGDATFHLWTLAVEEQFYLLWPVLLIIAWSRRRGVPALLIASGTLGTVACVAVWTHVAPHPDVAYTLPTSWVTSLVIGAAARVVADRPSASRDRVLRRAAPWALTTLLVSTLVPWRSFALTYPVGGPAIAALTSIVLLAWRDRRVIDSRPLRAMAALGIVSYGAYLWNYPLTLWLRPVLPGPAAGVLAAALTLVAAALSWRLVERPALRRWAPRPAPAPPATAPGPAPAPATAPATAPVPVPPAAVRRRTGVSP
ncbi:acyltransferase family protein [Streptomyces sp. NPDC051569]|uniref:acyltransferase family protein n=1 Tax=Streptomyces sp. NPDC051569 TaxID=3365661 RepID=UPI0037B577C5